MPLWVGALPSLKRQRVVDKAHKVDRLRRQDAALLARGDGAENDAPATVDKEGQLEADE